MRTSVIASCVTSVVMMATVGGANAANTQMHAGVVTKITDGDTIHFAVANGAEGKTDLTIRMLGIDAPESHFPVPGKGNTNQGAFGTNASNYLASLIPVGTQAKLLDYGTDKYHRTLGRVAVPKGEANVQMVLAGQAAPYALCTGPSCDENFVKGQDVVKFAAACETARKAGRGIWNPRNPLKEMPYEFRRRMAGRPMNYYVADLQTRALYNPLDYKKVEVCQRVFFGTLADAKRAGFGH